MTTVTTLCQSQVEGFEAVLAQPPRPNEVVAIDCGTQGDCQITFECDGKLFEVMLSIEAPGGSIECNYLERLHGSENEEETDQIYSELTDLLAGLCQPWFKRFTAAAQESVHLSSTLHDSLYLKVLKLQLCTIDGKAEVREHDAFKGLHTSIPNSLCMEAVGVNVSTFKPSEIDIMETLKRDTVFKALVLGSIMCVKVIGHRCSSHSVEREISLLQRISEAHLNPRPHIPNLLGLVVSEDDQQLVLGFLMEFIERGHFESDLSSLNVESIPQTQRENWSEQIYNNLKRLHSIGVCWGDAKAGNIILDKESNPWLIDFGGGYTNEWVDAHLANSEKGDLQGLQRIMKFLHVSKKWNTEV